MWGTRHQTGRVLAVVAAIAACGDNHEGNTAPLVEGLSIVTDEDTPISRTLDIVDNEGDETTITFAKPPHGQVVMAGADTFMYVPDTDYNGTDAFVVTVSDGKAETTATVEVRIASINDAPAGEADDVATTEDMEVTTPASALLANDTDIDGDTLVIVEVGSASNGFVSLFDGEVTFFPSSNFVGNGSYLYTVSDGFASKEVLVVVAVGDVNDPPFAQDDFPVTAEDTALAIPVATLIQNDFDLEGQTLAITSVAAATNGTAALAGSTITFTPAPNFHGTATFTYTLSDGAATDTGTVFVTVTPVNDPPIAVADSVTTTEDVPVVISEATMIANDTDVDLGTTLIVTAAGSAVNGSVVFANGSATFAPTASFSGAASFQYTVFDGETSATGTVSVTVVADAGAGP